METAGQRLKRARERMKLTYREVEAASQQLSERLGNPEFSIALSRLADIENKGTVPSLHRLFSLCVIYRLEQADVANWYGVPSDRAPAESLHTQHASTHLSEFTADGVAPIPVLAAEGLDPNKTTFLSRVILGWGRMPLRYLHAMDPHRHRYGWIGLEDWSMYPILRPGSLVLIDERTRIARGGWTNEFDRPIYFFEKRDDFLCGWADLNGKTLMVQPHPASHEAPKAFRFPDEIELVGQVVGVAMPLESGARRRSARHPGAPAESPGPRGTTGAPPPAPQPGADRDS
jgi:transcriptional regulator with XRE-family HTH domain